MLHLFTLALLWLSAIGCGLLAGVYFAFSGFIMKALDRIDPASGVSAMNSINTVILKSSFMPIFLGTTLASFTLAVISVIRWGERGATAMLAGGILYVLGMFVVTMVFNVPLNNELLAVDQGSSEGSETWSRFLRDWTFWNTVRVATSVVACAFFIWAIAAYQA